MRKLDESVMGSPDTIPTIPEEPEVSDDAASLHSLTGMFKKRNKVAPLPESTTAAPARTAIEANFDPLHGMFMLASIQFPLPMFIQV